MNGPDELRQEIAALRERTARLNAAILRISASLDLDTVLREVVDSARALTGARYGMIATVDQAGAIQEFIAPGLSADERRHMAEWPHGYQFFEHLSALPGALRLADVSTYFRSLGYSEELWLSKTLQAMPMRHREVHVGNFFLGQKEGGQEFTDEDEEVLVLFASQAATAIANARTHRDEQRARADLEALVDTSPVGVVVFDARSGRPVSFNREARRIVKALCGSDSPPEQLLEVMACRRGDGREIRLDELPLADEFRNAETVRGEEIVLSVSDGRTRLIPGSLLIDPYVQVLSGRLHGCTLLPSRWSSTCAYVALRCPSGRDCNCPAMLGRCSSIALRSGSGWMLASTGSVCSARAAQAVGRASPRACQAIEGSLRDGLRGAGEEGRAAAFPRAAGGVNVM